MQTLTNKSRDTLYNTVSNEVTRARINLRHLKMDKYVEDMVDKIMFDLSCSAPQKAISCFNYSKEK